MLLALDLKKARSHRDVQVLANEWLAHYGQTPPAIREVERSIKSLILHSMGYKHDQPLSDQELEMFQCPLNNSIPLMIDEEDELDMLVADDIYVFKVNSFLSTIWKEMIHQTIDIFEKLFDLLDTLIELEMTAARYTALTFVEIIGTVRFHFYTEVKDGTAYDPADIEHFTRHFIKFGMKCLRDEFLKIRKNAFLMFAKLRISYPSVFVNSSELKFLLWAMHDEHGTLRARAINATVELLTDKRVTLSETVRKPLLLNVIKRVYDLNERVAFKAVTGATVIQHACPSYFDTRMLKGMILSMVSSHQTVGKAAGVFIYNSIKLQNHLYTYKSFLKNLLAFIIVIKDLMGNCHTVLVRTLLPVAEKEFTDWQAWTDLLINDDDIEEDLKELACFVLVYVTNVCITNSYKDEFLHDMGSFPALSCNKQVTNEDPEELVLSQDTRELHEAVTKHFSIHLLDLWQKFETEPKCLEYLLKLPRQFLHLNNLNVNQVYQYLIELRCRSNECLEGKFATLAAILNLMRSTDLWESCGAVMERQLIDFCGDRFSKSCIWLVAIKCSSMNDATHVTPPQVQKSLQYNLHVAFYVSRYFDLKDVALRNIPFSALRHSIENYHQEVIVTCGFMCVFIIIWEMKGLIEPNGNVTLQVQQLKDHVRKLISLLEPFLHSKNESLKENVFTILCKAYSLCSPGSAVVYRVPELKIEPLDTVITEWISFHLICNTPLDAVPHQLESYYKALSTLEKYCLLLVTGVIDLCNMACILPYFKFDGQNKNYNETLHNALKRMKDHKNFYMTFTSSLEALHECYTAHEALVIAQGVCNAGIRQIDQPSVVETISCGIVEYGVLIVIRKNNFSFLNVLAPFVALMAEGDTYAVMRKTYDGLNENVRHPDVKMFMQTLLKRFSQSEWP